MWSFTLGSTLKYFCVVAEVLDPKLYPRNLAQNFQIMVFEQYFKCFFNNLRTYKYIPKHNEDL